MLAGLPKAPSRYNPRSSPDLAAARASEVLEAMVETGAITKPQMEAELGRMRIPPPASRQAGWFADWALEDLAETFPGNADLVLRATLNAKLQAVVEARLEALLAGPGARAGVTQGAVVVLDAATGAVRAMAGGRDFRASQFNRATSARRQPGSAFKPFVYLAALEKGMRPEDDGLRRAASRLGGWSPGNGELEAARRDHRWRRRWRSRSTPPPCGCCSAPAGRARRPRRRGGSGSTAASRTTPPSRSAPGR